jgi:hypothetical protein
MVHGVTTQKTELFAIGAVGTSNSIKHFHCNTRLAFRITWLLDLVHCLVFGIEYGILETFYVSAHWEDIVKDWSRPQEGRPTNKCFYICFPKCVPFVPYQTWVRTGNPVIL